MYEDWLYEYAESVTEWLEGQLRRYPVLERLYFVEPAVCKAMFGAKEKSDALPENGDYFRGKTQYLRWLRATAYREALRVLLFFEPIEAAVIGMKEHDRRLLRWSYIDQLTEHDLGMILQIETNDRNFFDDAVVRNRIKEAYEDLCRRLARLYAPDGYIPAGPHVEHETVFPMPPNVSRIRQEGGAS